MNLFDAITKITDAHCLAQGYTRKCAQCSKHFAPFGPQQIFCSVGCEQKNDTAECAECGEPIEDRMYVKRVGGLHLKCDQ